MEDAPKPPGADRDARPLASIGQRIRQGRYRRVSEELPTLTSRPFTSGVAIGPADHTTRGEGLRTKTGLGKESRTSLMAWVRRVGLGRLRRHPARGPPGSELRTTSLAKCPADIVGGPVRNGLRALRPSQHAAPSTGQQSKFLPDWE